MTRHRLRQGNLMGPAGFLGLEDNEAIKFVQDGMQRGAEWRASREARSRRRSRHRRQPDFGSGDPGHVQTLACGDGALSHGSRHRSATHPLLRSMDPRLEAVLLRHEIETFNARYAAGAG